MDIGGYGYEKTELLQLTEEIYQLKEEKKKLELQLDSEKFHQRYIPQRKNLTQELAVRTLALILPLTVIVVICFAFFVEAILDTEFAQGNTALLLIVMVLVFGGYADYRLIKKEVRLLLLLMVSKDEMKGNSLARRFHITTLQMDEAGSKKKIEYLEEQIFGVEKKIKELSDSQNALLEAKQQQENTLRKYGVLYDERPDKEKSATDKKSKFSLKDEDVSMGVYDIGQILAFYEREEQYICNHLIKLEGQIEHVNREITRIRDDFEQVKHQMILTAVLYVGVAFIQSLFSGILSSITSVLCMIGSITLFFYLERKWKPPIIKYLVENENKYIQEYAFCNNLIPVYRKGQELKEVLEDYKKELAAIKEKKAKL